MSFVNVHVGCGSCVNSTERLQPGLTTALIHSLTVSSLSFLSKRCKVGQVYNVTTGLYKAVELKLTVKSDDNEELHDDVTEGNCNPAGTFALRSGRLRQRREDGF